MASSTESAAARVIPVDGALAVGGVRLAAAASGLRYKGRDDLCLIELAEGSTVHCLYTTNLFCAAPVTVARRHQRAAAPRYLIVNAGNANAGTGAAGEHAARAVCGAVAERGGCALEAVLPFSTGVIGQQLDAAGLSRKVPELFGALDPEGWPAAAAAILTTDTRPKLRCARVRGEGQEFVVVGMAKGSGMIRPDLATMLAYVATDAAVEATALEQLAQEAAAASFNRITVDGDTSTNDAFAVIATGAAGNAPISSPDCASYADLGAALEHVCGELARDIVRDGEGATKFVGVTVRGGPSVADCLAVAYAVAESPLVKTALFASDPNWGRILAAVGRAGAAELAIDAVDIDIGPCPVVRRGEPVPGYDEAAVAEVMRAADIDIDIAIGHGAERATIWTCDLSYDYVKINAEYRS